MTLRLGSPRDERRPHAVIPAVFRPDGRGRPRARHLLVAEILYLAAGGPEKDVSLHVDSPGGPPMASPHGLGPDRPGTGVPLRPPRWARPARRHRDAQQVFGGDHVSWERRCSLFYERPDVLVALGEVRKEKPPNP
jgi:hypothetical protein